MFGDVSVLSCCLLCCFLLVRLILLLCPTIIRDLADDYLTAMGVPFGNRTVVLRPRFRSYLVVAAESGHQLLKIRPTWVLGHGRDPPAFNGQSAVAAVLFHSCPLLSPFTVELLIIDRLFKGNNLSCWFDRGAHFPALPRGGHILVGGRFREWEGWFVLVKRALQV
jgi:hypothetical protein